MEADTVTPTLTEAGQGIRIHRVVVKVARRYMYLRRHINTGVMLVKAQGTVGLGKRSGAMAGRASIVIVGPKSLSIIAVEEANRNAAGVKKARGATIRIRRGRGERRRGRSEEKNAAGAKTKKGERKRETKRLVRNIVAQIRRG